MNYHFAGGVRSVLERARDEALKQRHDYVGTEHILLGVIAESIRRTDEPRLGGRDVPFPMLVFGALGVDPERLKPLVLGALRRGKRSVSRGELPYTSRAKKVLEYSISEARDRSDSYVGVEHLVLGLIREEKGIAAQVFRTSGVTLEGARSALADVRSDREGQSDAGTRTGRETSSGSPPVVGRVARGEGSVWYLEVDEGSDTPLYEQIVARIEEAVAMGRLEPGERLPSVRDLAAELGIAPGTVARAYSELETLGVVETDGARGTRVAIRPPSKRDSRTSTVAYLERELRRVVVGAFHRGASAEITRDALERAMKGILRML